MEINLTYSEAFETLEKLVAQIEQESLPLDSLADKISEAKELISFCENKLRLLESDINKVLDK